MSGKGASADLKQRLGRSSEGQRKPQGSAPPTNPEPATPPAITAGEVVDIPLELVDPSPYQLASRGLSKRDVEDLIVAIRANGQLQPIIVSRTEHEGRYVSHSGHRRCAALRFLGATTVRAIVCELDEREARRIVVGDNLGRKDLSALEKADALRDYCEAYPKLKLEDASTELGIKKRTAQRLVALQRASEGLRDILTSARIPARPAAALVKIEMREPKKALRLAEQYAAGKVTADQLEKHTQGTGKRSVSPPARKTADVKVSHREVRLAVNLTRSQIQLRAGAVEEAIAAIAEFLGHIGWQTVKAADVGEFDAMREVTQ